MERSYIMISFQKYTVASHFQSGLVVGIWGSLLFTLSQSFVKTPVAVVIAVVSKLSLNLCVFLLNLCLSSSALMESLITPLQDKIEDWKKTANQLDKDHAKGTYTHRRL